VLKPGGVFYNSYNTLPGWLHGMPFQHLVMLENRRMPGHAAIKSAQEIVEAIKEAAPAFERNLPGLQSRLESMKTQDPAYLVQEYNNEFWEPMFVSKMIDAMEGVKLSYLGTATASEAFVSHLPQALRERIAQQPTAQMREQLRDYAITQGFRRDIYAKGYRRYWTATQVRKLRESMFVRNPFATRPEKGEPFKIRAGGMELNGSHDAYMRLLDKLDTAGDAGCTLGELMDTETEKVRKNGVIETMSMMLQGGWVVQRLPETSTDAIPLHRFAAMISEGAPYRYFPLTRTGGAITLSDTDWFVLNHVANNVPEAELPDALVGTLAQLGRVLADKGQPIKDPAETKVAAVRSVTDFLEKRLPFLRANSAL